MHVETYKTKLGKREARASQHEGTPLRFSQKQQKGVSKMALKFETRPVEHIEYETYASYYYTERVKAVLNGSSKRTKGFTQHEVACLFVHDKEAHSSTDNFRSENGILWHYRTVEALKTLNGIIINNRNCWSRGFAKCTSPPLINYSLNLSIFPFRVEKLRQLEIIDHVDKSQNDRAATLVEIDEVYLLNAYDEGRPFVAELYGKPRTVKEAFESMKPKIVKMAQAMNLGVKRQGELFFIPTEVKTSQVTGTKKRTRKRCTRVYFQCQKCGIKTRPQIWERDPKENNDYKPWHPSFYWSKPPNVTDQQYTCNGTSEDMKPVFYQGWEYSPYPQIGDTRHSATRLGKYTEVRAHTRMHFTVAQGIVRHSEHSSLKLGKQWHIVAKNRVKASYTQIGID